MRVKRPVTVKVVLTPSLRRELVQEYNESIQKVELEIEQLIFQSKKLLFDAVKKSPETQMAAQERLDREEKIRKEKMKQYAEMLSQLSRLPDGSELEHSRMETEVEVNVGDKWDKLIGKQEIIVKDGIIIELRNAGE